MRPLRFRLTALVAAYALALHTLLLAVVAVAPLKPELHFGALCSGIASDDTQAPVRHNIACAAACTVLSGAVAQPQPPAILPFAPVLALILDATSGNAPPNTPIVGVPRARAPPLV